MLTAIKAKATGWIAWAIVILITIPFALWGVNSYFTQGAFVNVAEFDGGEIDYQTFQNALYQERDRLRQRFGSSIDPVLLSSGVLGRQVINALVGDRLLVQDVIQQGYRVSDEQLLEAILAEEAFHDENGFNQDLYERMLRLSGFSTIEFEAIQRNSAALQQLQTGYIETSLGLDAEIDYVLSLIYQGRIGEYAVIDSTRLVPEIDITDADLQSQYENNLSSYQQPEQIKVQYIEIVPTDFAQGYRPSEDTLRNLYDTQSTEFRGQEQRSVSHILLETQERGAEKVEAEANELVERIRDGEDFADLARQHSADFGSAEGGGSIGWISKGATEPEFDATAFSLEKGQISDPIHTSFGVHILRVDEIRAGEIKEFEEVRDELIERAVRIQAEEEMFELSEELANLAYEEPESLEPVASQLGLSLKVSDWFGPMEGTGLGDNAAVRTAAFSEDVLENQFNSGVLDLGDGRQVVIRMLDYQESNQLPLEDVKAQITEQLLVAKSIEETEIFAKELIDQLESGRDWNEVLTENGLRSSPLPTSNVETISQLEQRLMEDVFSAGKPRAGGTVFGYGFDGISQYSIFKVTGVTDGYASDATDEERQSIRQSLQYRFGDSLYENYLTNLAAGVEITINEELIEFSDEGLR